MFFIENDNFDRILLKLYGVFDGLSFWRGNQCLITTVMTCRGQRNYTINGVAISLLMLFYSSEFVWMYLTRDNLTPPFYFEYDVIHVIVVQYGHTKPYQLLTYSAVFFYSFLYNQAIYFPPKASINNQLFYEVISTELDPVQSRYFGDFDRMTQIQIKVLILILEIVMFLVRFFSALGFVLLVPTIVYFIAFNINPDPLRFIILVVQIIPISLAIYKTFKHSFYKLSFSFIMSYVYIFRFVYINHLASKINNVSQWRQVKCLLVNYVLKKHNKLCVYIWKMNSLWSKLLAIFVWLNIPINIYWLNQLSNLKIQLSEYVVTLMAGLCQLIGIYIVLLNAALINRHAHRWRHLYNLQLSPRQQLTLSTKFKILMFIEKLGSKRKIGISIGPSAVVTINGSVQFIFMYFCYFLMINKFNREQ